MRVTLIDNLGAYLAELSGAAILIVGGSIVPALTRRRRALIAAGAVVVGTLVWANSPVTGLPDHRILSGGTASTVRYLMPVFAAGALALALAATDDSGSFRLAALGTLLGAIVWGLYTDIKHGFYLPFSSWLLYGIIAGSVLAAVPLGSGAIRRARLSSVAFAVGALLLGSLVLSAASSGYLARHARVASQWDAPVAAYLSSLPSFVHDRLPVAATPITLGLLAGDRLRHRISLIGPRETCAAVRARVQHGWVIVRTVFPHALSGHPDVTYPDPGTAPYCLAGVIPRFATGPYRVYGPGS